MCRSLCIRPACPRRAEHPQGDTRRGGWMQVLVVSRDCVELCPCHPARARKLLRSGRAVVHRKKPFTIRLTDRTASEVRGSEGRALPEGGQE
jgi:hypothetical protein